MSGNVDVGLQWCWITVMLWLQGIGCYMFRIDDCEVVDATMHGSAARFINHSCEVSLAISEAFERLGLSAISGLSSSGGLNLKSGWYFPLLPCLPLPHPLSMHTEERYACKKFDPSPFPPFSHPLPSTPYPLYACWRDWFAGKRTAKHWNCSKSITLALFASGNRFAIQVPRYRVKWESSENLFIWFTLRGHLQLKVYGKTCWFGLLWLDFKQCLLPNVWFLASTSHACIEK